MKAFPVVSVLVVTFVASAVAADSPQFRGPDRDGIFPETGLMKTWPADGPPLVWAVTGIGAGYSAAAVVDNTAYVPGMKDDNQGYISVIDGAGTLVKQVPYGEETQNGQAPGPRATPTVDGNRLYMLSGIGVLSCFELPDFGALWSVDIPDRFHSRNITWDFAESVLVDGDKVICTPGGPDACIAALDKMTGETVWTSRGLDDGAAYCSADIFVHNGHRILVTETARLVVGLDPENGQVFWTHPHETSYDVHAVTPVYGDGMIYFSDGYGSGGGMLLLSEDGRSITPGWTDDNLDCQHHGLVLVDGYIYGTGHQQHRGLLCMELKTGKVMWATREVRQGQIAFADGMLYVYGDVKRGVVSLVKASPEGFERTGAFEVTQGENQHWAHPAISNGHLYIRHGDAMMAYDIAVK